MVFASLALSRTGSAPAHLVIQASLVHAVTALAALTFNLLCAQHSTTQRHSTNLTRRTLCNQRYGSALHTLLNATHHLSTTCTQSIPKIAERRPLDLQLPALPFPSRRFKTSLANNVYSHPPCKPPSNVLTHTQKLRHVGLALGGMNVRACMLAVRKSTPQLSACYAILNYPQLYRASLHHLHHLPHLHLPELRFHTLTHSPTDQPTFQQCTGPQHATVAHDVLSPREPV